MPRQLCFIKNIEVDEISAVDLAANRNRFIMFKSATGEPGAEPEEVKSMPGSVHGRRTKQEEVEVPVEATVAGPEVPDEAPTGPEPVVEEGVMLYPWGQCIADMGTGYSTDDGPRICGLLLAKYGEGPGGEIKLPDGADPLEEAKTVIGEGEKVVKENPLLRPEGNEAATNATKSVVAAAFKEVLAPIFGPRQKKKAEPVELLSEQVASLTDNVNKLTLLVTKGHETPAPEPEKKTDEPAPVTEPAEGEPVPVTEPAEGEPAPEQEKATDGQEGELKQILAVMQGFSDRLEQLEQKKGVRKSVATQVRGAKAGGTYHSSIFGADLSRARVKEHWDKMPTS